MADMARTRKGSQGRKKEPSVVEVTLASSAYEYLSRAFELGAVEGTLGRMKLPPSLKPIVEAFNHVLAGGKVKVEVTQRGDPEIVADLNRRLAQGFAEANAINKVLGYQHAKMV